MSTPEEIQADIERQREHLAQTVDALGHKLDVKEQARAHQTQLAGAAAALVVGLGLVIWLSRRR